MAQTKILMVCLGNICRSPLAEGILQSKLNPEEFRVDSAGTGSWHIGDRPDRRSIAVGNQNGIDISTQRGRQFSPQDFLGFDHIYVMDQKNLEDVHGLAQNENQQQKVQMILDVLFPGEQVDVPDPYYGDHEDFERVYTMLDEACTVLAEQLQNS